MQIEMEYLQIILQILPYIVGVGGGGLIAFIVYRKQNQRVKEAEAKLKESEAKQSSIETQMQEIDLGAHYIEQSFAMQQQMQQLLQTNNADTAKIAAEVTEVKGTVAGVSKQLSTTNKEVAMIKRYLNGQFKEFVEAEKAKRKK